MKSGSKDIMENWKKAIDLNDDLICTNKELIKHVSDTNDRNKELAECLKTNNADIVRLCDVLTDMIDRMNDIELRLNALYNVLLVLLDSKGETK